MLRVQQLMTQNVYCCHQDDSLERAVQLMWEHDIGAVVVVDDAGVVVGVVTVADVARAVELAPLSRPSS